MMHYFQCDVDTETGDKIRKKQASCLLLGAVAWNELVYCGANFLTAGRMRFVFELPLDRATPFLPWSVSVYFACFAFWAFNYFLCTRLPTRERNRFFAADFLAKAVCLVLFLLLPTTNVRPAVPGSSVWDVLMRLLYQADAPTNLFPSIHCLVSWLSFLGVRRHPGVPKWYRAFSCLMACAVFASTLTTKQHVAVDVLAGVLLAEGCYRLVEKIGFQGVFEGWLANLK